MNRKQKIRYLKMYQEAKKEIKSIKLSIEELNTFMFNVTQAINPAKVQTSPEPDSLTELIAKKEALLIRLNTRQAEALSIMENVMRAIETVDNSLQHAILVRRYITGVSLEDIADELNYEYSWLTRLHNRAIDSIRL